MQKKDAGSIPQIVFTEQTPGMLSGAEKPDPLYEKAFLSREDKSETEFARNTTVWD